jgi:uncharacterized protein
MTDRWRQFWFGCITELLLLAVAWAIAALLRWPLFGMTRLDRAGVLWGIAATVPMVVAFRWTLRSDSPSLAIIRQFLEHVVRPIFGSWSIWQLGAISILAGICEEGLFRGLIQARLAPVIGSWGALAVASVAFGFAHPMNRPYIIAATITGLYLGGLFLLTGNLLAPVIAHAVYDFCALIYFLRVYRSDPR